jgi:integrase
VLLASIDTYRGGPKTIAATKLAVHLHSRRRVTVRRVERVRHGRGMWRVPTGRMKGWIWHKANGDDHLVLLSKQAIALLEDLRPLTGRYKLVFAGAVAATRPVTGEAGADEARTR